MKFLSSVLICLCAAFPANSEEILKWDFSEPEWKGNENRDLVSGTVGKCQAGPVFEDGELVFSDKRFIDVPDISGENLPTDALTVSARAAIRKGEKWGNIVGYLQDNGSYERGWSLGYDGSNFVFWISNGGPRIVVNSKRPIRLDEWTDLTATFDGEKIRLYVNGALSGQRAAPGKIAYPEQAEFTIGAYRDDDEFFPMEGKLLAVVISDSAMSEVEIREAAGLPVPLEFSIRPSLQFLSTSSAVINWAVTGESESRVLFGKTEKLEQSTSGKRLDSGESSALLENLEPQQVYFYRMVHGSGKAAKESSVYEFNTALNFSPPFQSSEVDPTEERGFAVVLGADWKPIERLLKETASAIVVFESDAEKTNLLRKKLYGKGLHGSRVTVFQVEDFANLPITSCMADQVVCDSWRDEFSISEVKRILVPGRGRTYFFDNAGKKTPDDFVRPETKDSGSWSHQYGTAGNSTTSGEALSGSTSTDDLKVQWFGRPGADFGLDRQSRMPAPLAVNGRLFHQGMDRLVAMNSANGTVLWSVEIPEFQRLNMPRDASNWCADEDHLFVAVHERAWVFDAETGERKAAIKTTGEMENRNWGYIARDGDRLIGSTIKKASSYTGYWTSKMWFDGKAGSHGTAPVCSDSLFAYDSETLSPVWNYKKGVVLNPTISISDSRIYFVESRNEIAKSSLTSQISAPELWKDQFLVALDLKDGTKLWERPIDTEDGTVTFYMQATPEAILITASNTAYHFAAFDPADGKPLWKRSNPWPADHHSGHIQHPVIVDGMIYLQPNGYDLKSGKITTKNVGERSGCHTYVGARDALIYRGAGRRVAMWNRETESVSTWDRLRPSCWLSFIPANGMLLVPEGGGGCSCGGWMETSIGFAPLKLLQQGGEK